LKSPGFESSWLKNLGLKGPGLNLGVEKSGVEMSFNHDAGNEYTSLEDAQNAALYAKEQRLGGKYKDCFQTNVPL
jgi:hypothetical protein